MKLKDAPGATVCDGGAMAMWSRWAVAVGDVGDVGSVGVVEGGGVDVPVGELVSVRVCVPHPAPRTAISEREEIVSSRLFSIYGPSVFQTRVVPK